MAEHNERGHMGELMAADYLEHKGYRILHRNWHATRSRKELDIVAEHEGWLIVVEVKSRKSRDFGEPFEAVDWRKQRNLMMGANAYVQQYRIDLPIRFDIVGVIGEGDDVEIDHIERAFLPSVRYY